MKSLLSFLFLFFALVGVTQAQLGLKAGITTSNLVIDDGDIEDRNANIGFSAGLLYRAELTDWFSLQPELLYTQKGASYETASIDYDVNLGYVDVPVLLMFHPFGEVINIYAGPQASYLLGVNYELSDGITNTAIEFERDRDSFNDLDVGLVIGAGVTLGNVIVDFRVARGYIDIDDDTNFDDIEINTDNRNFNATLSVGVFF